MQAVIMAGGKGTRLAGLTKDEIPKPMVKVAGKPLLERQIECFKENGITDIIMVVGHLADKIKDYFGNGSEFGINITYITEDEPLGSAGSLYYLKDILKEDTFILVSGDILFDVDFSRIIRFHEEKRRESSALATLFVHPNSHPYDSDLIVLDRDDRVTGFKPKNGTRDFWYDNCVNAGIFVLDRTVCDRVPEPVKKNLENDIIKAMIEDGDPVYGYRSPEYVKDLGTPERIEQAEKDIRRGIVEEKCLKNKQKCIFMDRDGTINVYRRFIYEDDDLELLPNAAEAIGKINESGRLGIVITNQPVVARGLCTIEDVERIHRKLFTLLGEKGVYVDDLYFCPHHPDSGFTGENSAYKMVCDCRKPAIGLILRAAEKYNIDLSGSWMVGDTLRDIQTGVNAGMRTAMVRTGEGGKITHDSGFDVEPDIVCDDLLEAVEKILEEI